MRYIPEQGDIVWLNFDPASGKEIIKRRPAFIISKIAFNKHTSLAIVAPITSTIRGIALEVVLPEQMVTSGAILVYQMKSFDFTKREIKFIEKASISIIEQVLLIAQTIVS